MKLQVIEISLAEETPIETKAVCRFEDSSELIFKASQQQIEINHGLKKHGCNLDEVTKYSKRIKAMLNQFDEASDYPVSSVVPPIS